MADGPAATLLLIHLSRAVYRRATEPVLGMRLKEFIVLSTLDHLDGEIGQRELGERMMLDPNNTVLLLNELEVKDYAERRRDPEDRRRHLVSITDEGRKALREAELAIGTLEDEVLRALDPVERSRLQELLLQALRGL